MSFAITWTRFTFRTLVVSLNVICNHLDTFYIQDTGGQSECHLQSPGHVLHSGHWWSVGMSFAITWTRFTFRTLVVSLNVICNHLDTFYIQDTGGQSECHQSLGFHTHYGFSDWRIQTGLSVWETARVCHGITVETGNGLDNFDCGNTLNTKQMGVSWKKTYIYTSR